MELRLYFEDYETGETSEKIIPSPDGEALRQALEEVFGEPEQYAVAVLAHSNELDFVQFHLLVPEAEFYPAAVGDIDEMVESLKIDPETVYDYLYKEEAASAGLCHVEYCEAHWGGRHSHFFSEKLRLDVVLEIFQRYLCGDEGWKKESEWKKLVKSGPDTSKDFRDKLGSLAMAVIFLTVGCLFPFLTGDSGFGSWLMGGMCIFFGALFAWNTFRDIGFKAGKPWAKEADARWDSYDEGVPRPVAEKEKLGKPAPKKKPGKPAKSLAESAESGCGYLYIGGAIFFIIFGILSGTCRNKFNRKAGKDPAGQQVEEKAVEESGLKRPGPRKPPR